VSIVFGKKRYELSDWLGNVRVVINDRKTPVNIGATTVGYKAQVINVNDYYSYGSTINERTYDYSSTKFRFAFNGKELDNEVYGFGNFQDYGSRMYNTRLGRFISPDPLIVGQKKYAWLSGYQFASNRPIDGIDIDMDGLEGFQYLELIKKSDGSTQIKRIVELDIHIAISKRENSIHYKPSDVSIIQSQLQNEFNIGFKDQNNNDVEFRFNIKEFDADEIEPKVKASQIIKDPNNWILEDGKGISQRGIVLEKGKLREGIQGQTILNHVIINHKALDPSHSLAHEIGHVFLNYNDNINPVGKEKHNALGGIFKYAEIDDGGNTIIKPEKLSKQNVDLFLKTLPEVKNQSKEEK
jgi:RHS repeat-associated protein